MRLWPANPTGAALAEDEHWRLRNGKAGNTPNFVEHLLAIAEVTDDDAFEPGTSTPGKSISDLPAGYQHSLRAPASRAQPGSLPMVAGSGSR